MPEGENSSVSVRLFDHIDLRVTSVAAARPLYDVFLPSVGFGDIKSGTGWASYTATVKDGSPRPPFVELTGHPGHRGGANRIAFWAETEEEVNRIGEVVRSAGALVLEGPGYCHDYTPGYYALFFEDADGNKWEVCCRTARVRTEAERGVTQPNQP